MLQSQNRIAKPSGKLCNARPTLTIIPVFSSVLLWFADVFLLFCENFLSTITSHIIIAMIPTIIPTNTDNKFAIANASGIKSKHTMAIISPEAKDSIKLKNLLEVFLNFTPIIPPMVVPKVPKNSPTNVVFIISFKIKTPFKIE